MTATDASASCATRHGLIVRTTLRLGALLTRWSESLIARSHRRRPCTLPDPRLMLEQQRALRARDRRRDEIYATLPRWR